jgi:hypothetical protein
MNNNLDTLVDRLYPDLISMRFNKKTLHWSVTIDDDGSHRNFGGEYLFEALQKALVFKINKKRVKAPPSNHITPYTQVQ